MPIGVIITFQALSYLPVEAKQKVSLLKVTRVRLRLYLRILSDRFHSLHFLKIWRHKSHQLAAHLELFAVTMASYAYAHRAHKVTNNNN